MLFRSFISVPPSPRPLLHIPSLQLAFQLDTCSNTWDRLQTSYLALLNRSDASLIKGKAKSPSHSPLSDSGLSVPHIHLSPLERSTPLLHPPTHQTSNPTPASYYYLSKGHFHNLVCFNGDTLHISSLHSHIQPNARIHHLTDQLSFLILPSFLPQNDHIYEAFTSTKLLPSNLTTPTSPLRIDAPHLGTTFSQT